MTDNAQQRPSHVVVLGAGPGGLAAAHHLAAKGVPTTILEKEYRVGGLCVTYVQDGFRFDLGGHRWFTKNEELHQWFLNLMEGELVDVDRISRIYFDGRYFNYPISISNVLKNAGIFTSAHALMSYMMAAVTDMVNKKQPKNIEEAYCRQFGHKLFDMFFRRYTEKVWGKPCNQLGADWATQRTKGLSIMTALREAVLPTRNVISLVDQFVYPRYGYERICIRMAEDIEKGAGEVKLSSPATRIYAGKSGGWVVDYGESGESLECSDLISTIPLGHLVRMIEPAAPDDVIQAAKDLEFRDLVTVTVLLKKDQVTPDTWLYIHDERIIFGRLHEPKNWSPDMVPGPEYTSLVCECFCTVNDEIWSMSEEDISARVVEDLADRLKFIVPEEVLDCVVVRTRYAYPVYDLQYRDKVDRIYKYLGEQKGIHVVGRGGTFRYNNADHSVEMGQLLGKKLLGEANDHMSVNTEKAYHEEILRNEALMHAGSTKNDGDDKH